MTKEEILYTALQDACDDLVSIQNDTKYIPSYMRKFDSRDDCFITYFANAKEYLESHKNKC